MIPCQYTVSFDDITFTTALGDYDFFELTPATNGPIEVVGFVISVNELGDAQEEFLRCAWVSGNVTTGNGTATTPRPVNSRVTHSAPLTAKTASSTPASTGTPIIIETLKIPARGGDRVWYPEGSGPSISAASTMLCLRLQGALADDATISGTVWVNVY